MADERQHLLTTLDDDMGYKNQGSDEEYNVKSAVALIKEQSKALQELRKELLEVRNKNAHLTEKIETISKELKNVTDNHNKDVEKNKKELDSLKSTFEVKYELQASIVDELKFQLQSMRNKIDSNRGLLIENNGTPRSSKQTDFSSPKKLLRNNSEDSISSSGSNPCLMSRVLSPQRVEFVWRINAFTKKLKKIQSKNYDEPSRSEPFTTGSHGYRLSMWAYLNGRGKGADRCLSLYVRVMAGEYDPILIWPVKPCYTFHLISQSHDPNKRLDLVRVRDLSLKHGGIARPQKDDKSIIVGFDDFIEHEDIEKKEYLAEDSLFIKCVVEIP